MPEAFERCRSACFLSARSLAPTSVGRASVVAAWAAIPRNYNMITSPFLSWSGGKRYRARARVFRLTNVNVAGFGGADFVGSFGFFGIVQEQLG